MAHLLGAAALLAGCAGAPDAAHTDPGGAGCGTSEPRTGTMIVRRESCTPQTPENRDAARRQVEAMQAEQERRRINGKAGN